MVLVGTLLASKLADTSKLETFKSSMKIKDDNVTTDVYNKSVLNWSPDCKKASVMPSVSSQGQ